MELTARIVKEVIAHEAIVREAYKDSIGVWTWSVGLTDATGHKVFPRYKDKPATLERCLEIYIWALDNKYVPAVREVFTGHDLLEHEFGAALSFHYNTGGLRRATWVKEWKAGNFAEALRTCMNWRKPPEIIPRRVKERDLFFDGKWTTDGTVTEYPVKKPSYRPDFSKGFAINVDDILDKLLG